MKVTSEDGYLKRNFSIERKTELGKRKKKKVFNKRYFPISGEILRDYTPNPVPDGTGMI